MGNGGSKSRRKIAGKAREDNREEKGEPAVQQVDEALRDAKQRQIIDEAEGEDELTLSDCEMGKEVGRMQYLSEFLKQNKTVKNLGLQGNQIGDEGMCFLSEGLEVNETVQMLFVDQNQIGDKGLRYLSEGLKVNRTVRNLVLNRNQIGDQGARYVSEVLKVSKTLFELSLSDNQVGDEGMQHLTEAIQMNTSTLYSVIVLRNPYSHDAQLAFDKAHADMRASLAAREEVLLQNV